MRSNISDLILNTNTKHIDLIRRAVIVIQNCYTQTQKDNAFKYAFLVAKRISLDHQKMFGVKDDQLEELTYAIYSKILRMHSCNYFGDHFNLYR